MEKVLLTALENIKKLKFENKQVFKMIRLEKKMVFFSQFSIIDFW
jgi:hypothetical protein